MKCITGSFFSLLIVIFPALLQAYSPQPSHSITPPVQDQHSSSTLSFSAEELAYLQSKKVIKMCIDPNWMPLEAICNGNHIGMTADYIQVMQKLLPVPIQMTPAESWLQSIEFAKTRQCDIFSLAMSTPERETYMAFTKPYLSIPLVMAAGINKPFVDDITSLHDVTLGVVKGYAFGELMRARFPDMVLVDVDSVTHGLQLVVEDEIDGFIGTLATVGYAIQQDFPGELKVAGKFDERWELGIATRNDEPLLLSVFDKIIGSLDQKTHQEILNHWISVKFDQGTDYTIVIRILVFAGLGMVLLLFKNYALRRYSSKLKAQHDEIVIQKEKLQETEKQLLLTQHAVDACVFPILWATQGKTLAETFIVHANQAAGHLLGYQVEQFTGLSLGDLDVESTEQSWLQSLKNIQDNNGLAIKTSYRCQDGRLLPVDIFISDFIYLDQSYLFLFVVDQTRQLEVESKLHRSLKMESIGLMAGGVAHDLNNILSGIIGYPDLLLMNLSEDSPMRDSIEAIRDSGLRAADVVADLLTVARGVAAEKHVSNLNILIDEYSHSPECKALKAKYPKVTFVHDLAQDLLNIECSMVHVKKCLMNLVGNAAESLESAGKIVITTANRYLEKPLSHNLNLPCGEYVVVTVADTGKGIKQEDIAHIFEPFYTKKKMGRSGTGLGLAVVWNTLDDHHGTVSVDSGEQGTRFKLYFPATRKELVSAPQTLLMDDLQGKGETILVVDDEEQQRDIAAQMLQSLQYKVVTVSSGEEAVNYLKTHPIDLVILDMIMAPGMNGRETFEQILKIHPGQKAIIASGFSVNTEVEKALQLGAGQFIKKPYLINQIGIAVQDALS